MSFRRSKNPAHNSSVNYKPNGFGRFGRLHHTHGLVGHNHQPAAKIQTHSDRPDANWARYGLKKDENMYNKKPLCQNKGSVSLMENT
jgi:hypothetical protein